MRPRPWAACLLIAAGLASGTALAQENGQDAVNRNLLERQQRESGFHVDLYDNTVPKPMGKRPSLPLPLESAPRSEIDLGPGLPPNPNTANPIAPLTTESSARKQLDLSQQQRLQQLQLQNKNLDEPLRQQQQQIQSLQFDRENQAQSLHDQIMRDSQGAMRQAR